MTKFGGGWAAAATLRTRVLEFLGAEPEWITGDHDDGVMTWTSGPVRTILEVQEGAANTPDLGVLRIWTPVAEVGNAAFARTLCNSLNLWTTTNRWTTASTWFEPDGAEVLQVSCAFVVSPLNAAVLEDFALSCVREQVAIATAKMTNDIADLIDGVPCRLPGASDSFRNEWHEVVYYYDRVIAPNRDLPATELLRGLAAAFEDLKREMFAEETGAGAGCHSVKVASLPGTAAAKTHSQSCDITPVTRRDVLCRYTGHQPLIRKNRLAALPGCALDATWPSERFLNTRSEKSAMHAGLVRQHWRMLDATDYELVWPPDLFADEARRILGRSRVDPSAIDLLREAFRDDSAAEDAASPAPFGSRDSGIVSLSAGDALAGLAEASHSIPRFSAPRPYWPQRQGKAAPGPHLDALRARDGFAGLIGELERTGYLEQTFPRPCVDDQDPPDPDPAAELEKRLGLPGLWPLAPDKWDESTFHGLIEVYHDLVARPRVRHLHSYAGCGWHYSQFSVAAGREVFRWKVNELLKAANIGYALAGTGEDVGRLVATYDDARSGLIDNVLANARPESASQVAHAVALFRSRTADAEYKRSAILALAACSKSAAS